MKYSTSRTTKALFLDRDGVINVNHGYVYKISDFDFIPGIFELCRKARRLGYEIVIVTNQSGIARRYYSQEQFEILSNWLQRQFWRQGISIRHIYHCPHHPKQQGRFGFSCTCRKPKPGMLYKARQQLGVDLSRSIMIGDSLSDVKCARRAGLGKAIYLAPKRTTFAPALEACNKKPYYRASTLTAASALL